MDAIGGNVIGLIISLIVVGYLISKSHLFT